MPADGPPLFFVLRVVILSCLVTLGACATSSKTPAMFDAAVTPLTDLNLVHAEIPAVLIEAQKRPYGPPAQLGCDGIVAEVRALDEVLGPDLDTPASASNPGLIERGSVAAAAGNAVVNTVRRTAESVVPFRSWVRRLSGAERYSKEVAAAIAAGTVRRAFLKGLATTELCLKNDAQTPVTKGKS
jgi:hypothetical protein